MATTGGTTITTFPNTQPIPEGSSRKYTTTLLDMDGASLLTGQITSIKFSLRDASSGSVINSRHRVEVRNANGGTWATGGLFSMVLSPEDTVAVGTSRLQKRRMLFEVTFNAGIENHEVDFYVENLNNIPPALPLSIAASDELLHLSDGTTGGLV